MNKFRKLTLVASGAALALVPLLISAQVDSAKAASQKITGKVLMAAEELKWVPMEGVEGAQQAVLWGDPKKEAHRILYKWPVGAKAPVHTHTAGDRGVVVSGVLSLAVDGAAPKKLSAGSFFSMAGGTKHATAVEGDAPCVFYIEREGAFDVIMAAEAGAKK